MSVTDLGGVAASRLEPNLDHQPFHSWIYLQKIREPSMKILISESETDGVCQRDFALFGEMLRKWIRQKKEMASQPTISLEAG